VSERGRRADFTREQFWDVKLRKKEQSSADKRIGIDRTINSTKIKLLTLTQNRGNFNAKCGEISFESHFIPLNKGDSLVL
jgi:hypothetical protein